MFKQGLAISIAALTLMGASATLPAAPITINDYDGVTGYIGGDATGASTGTDYGDVVGDPDTFNISSMEIEQNGTQFRFTVNTKFAGNAGIFQNYTEGNTGIGYGDLFLANAWSPAGSAPYLDDNAHAPDATDWTWGLILNDRFNNDGGTVSLARLPGSNLDTALLSDDLMTGNAEWRYGQEVIVDTSNTAIDSDSVELVTSSGGSWSLGAEQLQINFDLGQTDLLNGNTLAFHWGMTCANDVIEGEVDLAKKVPEPGTIGLVALALVAIFLLRRPSTKA